MSEDLNTSVLRLARERGITINDHGIAEADDGIDLIDFATAFANRSCAMNETFEQTIVQLWNETVAAEGDKLYPDLLIAFANRLAAWLAEGQEPFSYWYERENRFVSVPNKALNFDDAESAAYLVPVFLRPSPSKHEAPTAQKGESFEIEYPTYHTQAMGCGLEDRDITDRYEAMEYGWQCAIDAMAERIPENLYIHEPAPDPQQESHTDHGQDSPACGKEEV